LVPEKAGEERRTSAVRDRRKGGRGGRRRGEGQWPWWRRGLAFSALCVILRCWRWFRRRWPALLAGGPACRERMAHDTAWRLHRAGPPRGSFLGTFAFPAEVDGLSDALVRHHGSWRAAVRTDGVGDQRRTFL